MNADFEQGWLHSATRIESPNQDRRPQGVQVSLVVIHNISLPPDEFGGPGVIDFFTNRLDPTAHPYYRTIADLKVSTHFFVRRDGELIQLVSCDARAWHAGVSTWQGRERCNDFSIGIELEGCDTEPFADAQYACLNILLPRIRKHYPIEGVVGHQDISPSRKTDPGPCFDWTRIFG